MNKFTSSIDPTSNYMSIMDDIKRIIEDAGERIRDHSGALAHGGEDDRACDYDQSATFLEAARVMIDCAKERLSGE